jgi:hypothetical protein
MIDRVVLLSIYISILCLFVGFFGKLVQVKIFMENPTWISLAQTILLIGIAWGVGRKQLLEK